MDYFSMKRKELQALCKEHNIPANSANSVLADKLSQLLNEKEKPITRKRACLKSSVETPNEDEPAVSKREVKKVRFSPNNDVLEYQMRSGKKHVATPIGTKTKRKSVATKVDKLVVDKDGTNELNDDSVQIPDKRSSSRAQGRGAVRDVLKETSVVKEPEGNLGKVTRSKANLLAKGNVVQPEESKPSKKLVKDVKKGSGSVKETAVGRVRATRSKAQAVTDDSVGLDVNSQAKKKRGGQVAKDVPNVELSDEPMEIPARVTRSRHNSKEDTNNVVSNPKAEKKRTRRDMKATDQSSSLSNVASEDKQELPKRKSLRTRGVEIMDEDQGDKEEVVNGGRATRAKAQLAVKSGRDGKSRAEKKVVVPMEPKMVQKPEESMKKVGRKNVNQRKSVMPSKNSEVVIHPEEPVNHHTRNTRSTSVMPVAQEKVNEEPEVAGSLAIEKKLAKGKSVDVTKSGEVASELKTAVNATGSPKSRKRRGTPVTEDQGIGTNYGAVVDESARRSTRTAGESEGNSAANKQASSVKTPTSGIGKQPAAKGELSEGSQIGTRRALRSGAAMRGDSSNKRAKLIAPKQYDAEYSAVKSSKKVTPVSKLLNLEPGEKVVETELTPAIDGSRSQITRSAIRSDKTAGSLKKPSQTSNKKQPIGDAQISTRKAAKFRPDPAVNTAPGRVTRSGVKDRRNGSSYHAEKLEKKKPSRSARRVQPLDDAQISTLEVAEASSNPDVDSLGVQSEVYKEAMGGISGNTVDLSSPEMRLPTKVVEENMVSASETAIVVESIGTVIGEKSSGAELHSISNGSDAGARDVEEVMNAADASIENFSTQFTPNVVKPERGVTLGPTENLLSETQLKPLDLPSSGDETLLVPTLSETPLQPLSEVEVHISVNSEKLDANEMDSAEAGFLSTWQQTDVMVEEQVVSIETTVVLEDNAGVSLGDAENECDLGSHNIGSSAVYHDSSEQPDAISTKEVERPVEPSNIENGSELGAEDESASAPMSSATKLVSGDNNDTLDQATGDDKLQGLYLAENDIEDGMDAAHSSLTEPNVLPAQENLTSDDVADVLVDAGNEPAKERESDVVQSPDVMSTKEVEMSVEPSIIENGSEQGAEDERASAPTPLTTELVSEDNDDTLDRATDDDKLQGLYSAKNDFKDGMDATNGSLMEPNVLPAEENLTSEPPMELESDAVQSTDTDVHRSPIFGRSDNENDSPRFAKPDNDCGSPVLGKFDGEDANVNTRKECETDEGLNSEHLLQDPVPSDGDGHGDDEGASTNKDHESNPKPNNNNDVSDTSLGKNDDFNVNKQPEPTSEPSSFNDITETPHSTDDTSVEDQKAHSKTYGNDVFGAPLIGEDDVLVDAGNKSTEELESDVPSMGTSGDENGSPIFDTSVSRKFDGEDANGNEFEIDEGVNSNKEHMLPETALSGDEDGDMNTNDEHESDQMLVTSNDDDFSMTKQPESISEPSSSFNDIKEAPFPVGDIPQEAQDSYLKPLTGNDLIPIPVIREDCVTDDTISVPKELETGLEPSNNNETLEGHDSGNDVVNKYVVDDQSDAQDGESERDKLAINEGPGTDVVGSEFVVDDQSDEQDAESERNKLANNDSPDTDDQYAGGYDLEPKNNANMPAATEILISASHQESVPESNIARGKVTCYTAGVSDSVRPSDLPMSTEAPPTPATSGDEVASVTVDVLDESLPNINKDVVANIFGDIYGLGSTEVTDIKNAGGNEQMTIGTSENIEGVSKEGESVYPGTSDEQITEETNTTKEIYHASTSDQCLDGCSNLGVDEFDTELVEDLEAYEYPTREGSPPIMFTHEFSASPTSCKENDRNEQGETRETDTCQGLGDYSFGMDEQKPISANESYVLDEGQKGETRETDTCQGLGDYSFGMDEQKPISANESYVLDEGQKDNQVSDINTSARASFFKEGSSSSAAGLVDSVKSFDKASGHMTDGKSIRADVMKEKSDPRMNEEIFNWTGAGSSMRSLFTTSPAGQIQYVKDGQDDIISLVDQDHYSCQESLFTMSATTTNSYAKGGPEGPVDFANLNHYSSMKSLFSTTPSTATTSHVKGAQEDQVEYSNQYHYSSVKSLFATPATATVSHLQGGQDYAINSAFPDNSCNQGEDSTNKLFEDEVDGSSDGSGKNHFEFRSHQFDFLAESAGTGRHESASSIDGGSFEKETETQLKGPNTGDNNSF